MVDAFATWKEIQMFFIRNKIDYKLMHSIDNNLYKSYRVNIYCKTLAQSTEKA